MSLCGAAALVANTADAQSFGEPLYGSHSLQAGFMPDPVTQPVRAGGAMDLGTQERFQDATSGAQCVGFVNAGQPDYQLTYGGGAHLQIGARSSDDVTLLINMPDGSWRCVDDTVGFNPSLAFEPAPSGVYDVWVGTFGEEIVDAEVVVTEFRGETHFSGAPVSGPDIGDFLSPNVVGTYGVVQLNAGFTPDPHTIDLVAGGGVDLSTGAERLQTSAYGYVAQSADYLVQYSGGSLLKFYVESNGNGDAVLLVRTPSGHYHFVDDTVGLDPVLDFENAPAGDYHVWVGTIGSDTFSATLGVTELSSVGPTP